jgi:adenylate cyclase class 2
MYEVEVKVRAEHAAVREELAELAAEPLGGVTQVDTYFDAPHRDFAETDEALRIRRETRHEDEPDAETQARLTYKGPLVDRESKTREEIEAGVENGDDVTAILESVGFDPAATVRKDRKRFAHEGFVVTLDAVTDLGEFVEVETEVADEAAVDAAREDAFELLRALDLDPDDQIRTSYLGLLLDDSSQ